MDGPYGRTEIVAQNVRRLLAANPSPFTFTGTQTYIVGAGAVAVIDPGPDLPEHVAAITLDEIRARWGRYYKPRNATLVLVGAVDEGAASRAVANHFAQLPSGEEAPAPADPGGPRVGVVRESTVRAFRPQSAPMACVAYAAPNPGTELYAAFLVLAARFWAAA